MGKPEKLYMMVSNDRFELPMSFPMSAREMAKRTGLKIESVKWAATPSGALRIGRRKTNFRTKPYRIVSVFIEDEEEGLCNDPL